MLHAARQLPSWLTYNVRQNMNTAVLMSALLIASCVICSADVLVGSGKASKTGKKVEFILEYSEDREAVATALTKEGKKFNLHVIGIGTLYLDGERKRGLEFYIMKFGGAHDSLTGFYVYPGGYVGFLRVDLYEEEKPFVLYDDTLARSDVITGSITK